MDTATGPPAALTRTTAADLVVSGRWTAAWLQGIGPSLAALQVAPAPSLHVDARPVTALDSAGAWILQGLLAQLRSGGTVVTLSGLAAGPARLMEAAQRHAAIVPGQADGPAPAPPGLLARTGGNVLRAADQGVALLAFVGECALALAGTIAHPRRLRWRPVLFNIRSAGFDALPIVGLLSFLLGVVVAYQAADQLRRYGANIFVADLVGLSMLREFAPLMTAIIIAGRSGSAYAAQIGTMAVTEEIDAMRTLGIAPLEMLVLPKLLALVVALPLLTVFADLLGVFGGMVMARVQLGVSYSEFLDRFAKAISVTSYLIGIGKAPVFAAIIALVGCYQGMRTHGGPDSVGRQTTRAVVQGIFLVIVADALFSVAFSLLDL
jgi:phospholipid/cholesterol/gamma-HCH transport system permease protein